MADADQPRGHRGADPEDAAQLGPAALPRLRAAVADLAWLLGRGYAEVAALKVVGDRYGLTRRQRAAVSRSTCDDAALARRRAHEAPIEALRGAAVVIDGFNTLIPLERALGGGPLLVGRDGAVRDLAGVHGTWRVVAETDAAAELAGRVLADAGAASARWLLDQPVSNSGRLADRLRALAAAHGWAWTVEVLARPDPEVAASPDVVCTADGWILDRAARWFPLVRVAVERHAPAAWRVDLRDDAP